MLISDIKDYLFKELNIKNKIQFEYADLNAPQYYPEIRKI